VLSDARGLPLTAATSEAVANLDATVTAYCGLRNDTGDCLKRALAADPNLVMGHILRGYFMMLFGKRALAARAENALAAAEAATRTAGTTERERSHLAALSAWIRGEQRKALAGWGAILLDHPRDIVALKLAQYVSFYLGDSKEMRASIDRVLYAWDADVPGYGFVLGCHAFGAEESGDYGEAELIGRRAIDLNSADVWAAHAVAHVMEMQGRVREGIAWIDSLDGEWGDINNFVFHVRWHRCLFYLELERYEKVLELYDREVRAESTDEYLDVTNAVALLWRLEQAGVEVGARWAELAVHAAIHIDDHMLVFADVHYLMALAAKGDVDAVQRWLESSRCYARSSDEDEAPLMGEVGLTLAEAVLAHRLGNWGRVVDVLLPARQAIRRIGGSHAQRDLFEQMLIDAALKDGRLKLVRALLSERLQQRPHNAWGWKHTARAAELLGDAAGAAAAQAEAYRLLMA
jgi:tetratricopeptide (TPR) repeat protein